MRALIVLAGVLATVAVTASVALSAGKPQSNAFITDTLGGNGHAKYASHPAYGPKAGGITLITDTLGGRGGGSAIPASGTAFSWGAAGVGAAGAAGALFALFGATLLTLRRSHALRTVRHP
jgi:hypothetical protein